MVVGTRQPGPTWHAVVSRPPTCANGALGLVADGGDPCGVAELTGIVSCSVLVEPADQRGGPERGQISGEHMPPKSRIRLHQLTDVVERRHRARCLAHS